MFIERVSTSPGRIFPAGRVTLTDREKEVLEMLVAGRSNKEIGSALGIEERTVKAHVAKLDAQGWNTEPVALWFTLSPIHWLPQSRIIQKSSTLLTFMGRRASILYSSEQSFNHV